MLKAKFSDDPLRQLLFKSNNVIILNKNKNFDEIKCINVLAMYLIESKS